LLLPLDSAAGAAVAAAAMVAAGAVVAAGAAGAAGAVVAAGAAGAAGALVLDAAGVPPQAPSKLAIITSPTKPIACFLID